MVSHCCGCVHATHHAACVTVSLLQDVGPDNCLNASDSGSSTAAISFGAQRSASVSPQERTGGISTWLLYGPDIYAQSAAAAAAAKAAALQCFEDLPAAESGRDDDTEATARPLV
uniref:Uncharacterized protein n=1 Tax=Chlamydomonas euryale TaxID=1486919 RepID=A0A7R9YRU1_9CHLO|mmetsp:Transcript_15307/g.45085  ORF Transcript_15307/g.45085 Transcript_15307/m.45085 type:complete len:115 (+) Transcript_15307:846-1190(+)